MSLVGFKARNHAQQVLVRVQRSDVDDRALPPDDFATLDARFAFTIDVAASAENAKCERFFTPQEDGLEQDWTGERVYCNPPYSLIAPWIEKAHTAGADLVVMLLPASRTEQAWWQDLVEPFRDRPGGVRTEFLRGRLRFLKPGQVRIAPNERPPFGCVLLIWGGANR